MAGTLGCLKCRRLILITADRRVLRGYCILSVLSDLVCISKSDTAKYSVHSLMDRLMSDVRTVIMCTDKGSFISVLLPRLWSARYLGFQSHPAEI